MPLTAYSISEEKELDVEQIFRVLSRRTEIPIPTAVDQIPTTWREILHSDLECSCCFVTGADIVKQAVSRTSKQTIRQACFRFVLPGHHPQCDYASNDAANFIPENLIQFGAARTNLTRAVRELVCKGIQLKAFNQRTMRDMREWFFHKKTEAEIHVVLDPRIPKWIDTLWRSTGSLLDEIVYKVPLTPDIVSIPGFDWNAASKRSLAERHQTALTTIRTLKLWMHLGMGGRIEVLAKRHHGQKVFDPIALQHEYDKSLVLGRFISRNYFPIKRASKNSYDVVPSVLALSALILFANAWDLGRATNMFARISSSTGRADPDLGNVMGLNPFHDYEAWSKLKALQASGIVLPEQTDLNNELDRLEAELRARFQTPE